MQQAIGVSSAPVPVTPAAATAADLVTLILTVPASDLSAALAGHDGSSSTDDMSVAAMTLGDVKVESISDGIAEAPSMRSSFASFSRSALPTNDKAALEPATRTYTIQQVSPTSTGSNQAVPVASATEVSSTSASGSTSSSPTTSSSRSARGSSALSTSSASSSISYQAVTTIKVAAIPSIAIKPIVSGGTAGAGTDTMVVYVPAPTTTSNDNSNNSDFMHSLGTSPVNIALTALVCTGIAVLLIAAIAFFARRFRRRANRRKVARTRVSGIRIDQDCGRYSDQGSNYDDDAQPIMHQVTVPSGFGQSRPASGIAHQIGQHHFNPAYQFGTAATHNPLETENEKLRDEDWNNEMLQVRRRSEMDLSLVQHLHASQPFATPSLMEISASQIFNYAPTTASSPFIEPRLRSQLPTTCLGSFSASVPTSAVPVAMASRMRADGSRQSAHLKVPSRPNRPASLTSSFTHAIERDLAAHPVSPPTYLASPGTEGSPKTIWGSKVISQVIGASAGAVTTLLSPAPLSPTYDEEKADLFTALPDPASVRRPSVRWGSVTSLSSAAPDRRIYQQMGSRFSVTTLGTALTNSPTQSAETSSAYDYQIQSASVAPRRAAPVLLAQRESTPTHSDDDQASSDSSTLTDQVEGTPASEQQQWASTEPLNTASTRRPDLARLDSVRSTETGHSSIFDSADPEVDGYAMTEEEQAAMTALIRKRRAAAMAAK